MKQVVNEKLGELKAIVLELHRSAGNLDSIIQDIEVRMNDEKFDLDMVDILIRHNETYRMAYQNNKKDLAKRERDAWDDLTNAVFKKIWEGKES